MGQLYPWEFHLDFRHGLCKGAAPVQERLCLDGVGMRADLCHVGSCTGGFDSLWRTQFPGGGIVDRSGGVSLSEKGACFLWSLLLCDPFRSHVAAAEGGIWTWEDGPMEDAARIL